MRNAIDAGVAWLIAKAQLAEAAAVILRAGARDQRSAPLVGVSELGSRSQAPDAAWHVRASPHDGAELRTLRIEKKGERSKRRGPRLRSLAAPFPDESQLARRVHCAVT